MLTKKIPDMEASDLDKLYHEAEICDKRLFAEQRTNLSLVCGEHYTREGSKYWNRVRSDKSITDEQRIKLTKNHVQRITKIYINSIETYFPGVAVLPKNEKEIQHQKAAEQHHSVWQDAIDRLGVERKIKTSIKAFVEAGEIAAKVTWVNDAGQITAYEAIMDEQADGSMQPKMDETGQPVQNEEAPVYSGEASIDLIYGFNLKRDPGAGSIEESPFLIVTKMVSKNALFTLVPDEKDRKELEKASGYEYTIFDNNTGTYRKTNDHILLKEIYWRPCRAVPKGFYQLFIDSKIFSKGPLPEGMFPIFYAGFDEQTGNARSHSVIRHIRPNQIEINRCASKIAEHQVTLGDDKVYLKSTSKITQGGTLPGIRVNYVTGDAPTVTAGRTGDQYLPYMSAQIDEMYTLANLKEEIEEKPQQVDSFTQLFQSLANKKKYIIYSSKIERFWIQICKAYLTLMKCYAPVEMMIPILGKNEYVNMDEFKSSEDLMHQIKAIARTDDLESQYGKQLVINHAMQYIGQSLDKEDIGRMLRLSPFLNEEKMFEKFTQKWDNSQNVILSLDRGKFVPPRSQDDHKYLLQQLELRQGQASYDMLPPQIQKLYDMKIAIHNQIMAKQAQELQAAEAGFIPSGGFAVACDFYVSDPSNPNKTKRIRLPSESVNWLVNTLEKQGTMQDQLQGLSADGQEGIAKAVMNHGSGAMAQPGMAPHPLASSGAGGQAVQPPIFKAPLNVTQQPGGM